jgi:ATP-dependent 26S proteasome regulatory subunit
MDDATFESLRAAYALTPANHALLAVLLRASVARGDAQSGMRLLAGVDVRALPVDARCAAAEAWMAAGQPQDALDAAPGDTAPGLLLRARACAKLGRSAEGLAFYKAAVAENPTLEDVALRTLLAARDVARDGVRLKVIANDDTDRAQVTRLLEPERERIRFDDVGGLDEVKQQIRKRIVLPFQKPSLFQRFKKKVGGGILLFGPPGCGKTLLARATAGECDAKFFNVAITDVLDMYIGEAERKLHAIFEQARQKTPAVVFFDELEALAAKRQYTREATSSKIVSTFLAELDGFAQNNRGVLVIGATNVPWAIDPAMRRPGRFDRVVFVPPPDRAAREAILRILMGGRPAAADIDLESIARRTSGYSGADLANVVESSADAAIERSLESGSEQAIDASDLAGALREVKPTTLEWLTTARNYARYANDSGLYDDVLQFLDRNAKG